jgi:hypothetical protein
MVPNPVERAAPRSLASRWPVDWSAVWVGALSAVVLALIIALIGVAVGAHRVADTRMVRWSEFGLWSLIFTVGGAFLSFVVGGWVAGRIAGFFRAEPAILHGAIAWLLGVSLIMAMGSLGAFGPWYRGVIPLRAAAPTAVEDPDTARAARNAASTDRLVLDVRDSDGRPLGLASPLLLRGERNDFVPDRGGSTCAFSELEA